MTPHALIEQYEMHHEPPNLMNALDSYSQAVKLKSPGDPHRGIYLLRLAQTLDYAIDDGTLCAECYLYLPSDNTTSVYRPCTVPGGRSRLLRAVKEAVSALTSPVSRRIEACEHWIRYSRKY